jgi:Secretion system C-terminal sorting domain
MKNISSLLILVSIGFAGRSQGFIAFPDSGAIWVNTISYVEFVPIIHCELASTFNYCVDGEDTIINANTYSVVKICDQNIYVGAWRDINGIVYYVPPDSTSEYVLYDFTVEAGDTIPEVWIGSWPGGVYQNLSVDQIDSTLIWGTYRKVIYVGQGDYFWIEGIGCTQGLFMDPWVNISGVCFDLYCMSENDTTLYPYENLNSCYLGVEIEELNDFDFSLYPNPSSDGRFTIESKSKSENLFYKIFTPNGKVVQEGKLETDQIDLGIISGIYFIQVSDGHGLVTRRIIVE